MKAFLLDYAGRHPQARPVDFVKLLFQAAFGGEHLVADEAGTLARLKAEAEGLTEAQRAQPMAEPLPGSFCRMNLSALKMISPELLNRIFAVSSREKAENAEAVFEDGLAALTALCKEHPESFAFTAKELTEYLAAYKAQGLRPVSHSPEYRAAYGPAYRVVRREYAELLPLLAAIEKQLGTGEPVRVAIDGPCGSGKTQTAAKLQKIFDCNVFHADDFFLPLPKRTAERLAEPGGNMERERLAEEICEPVKRGEAFTFTPFDCTIMDLGAPVKVSPKQLSIFEGSYCMHPDLRGYYTLKVFLHIPREEQLRRLAVRENEAKLQRFINEWIPLEDRYFEAFRIAEAADLVLSPGHFPELK